MKRAPDLFSLLAIIVLFCGPAKAGTDFGTDEEADAMATRVIAMLDSAGLPATIEALFDPNLPFAASPLGINLFSGSVVVGDNREPEMVEADYSKNRDLTGKLFWPLVDAAADNREYVVLKWYHYDTQEVYDYHCLCARADIRDHTIMICR